MDHRKDKKSRTTKGRNITESSKSSPYCTPIWTVNIGLDGGPYQIHEGVLLRYPKLLDACCSDSGASLMGSIVMCEEVGHKLIHYLYTGKYEALGSDVSANKFVKLEGITQLYGIAVKYNITGLSEILQIHVRITANTMNIFNVLDIAQTVHQMLEKENGWFTSFLKTQMRAALVVNKDLFTTSRFVGLIGTDKSFDRMLMRIVAEIYNEKIAMQARLLQDRATVYTPCSLSISSLDDAPQQPQNFEESHLCQNGAVFCDGSLPCEAVVAFNNDHILFKEATLSSDELSSCEVKSSRCRFDESAVEKILSWRRRKERRG